MLNVWHIRCGHPSLSDFAKAEPTPNDLLACAHWILETYTTPAPVFGNVNPKAPAKDPVTGTESATIGDIMHRNIQLLTCNILYVMELVNAISTGDFGCIEDILPALVCMF